MSVMMIDEVQVFSMAQIHSKKNDRRWEFGKITTAKGVTFDDAVQTARVHCIADLKCGRLQCYSEDVQQLGIIILSFQAGLSYEVMYQPCWSFEY